MYCFLHIYGTVRQALILVLAKVYLSHVNTTVAFDNIDRIAEIISGGGTSQCVNGIIVQPKVYGPFFPTSFTKAPKGSLIDFIEDVHIAAHVPGTRPGPTEIQKPQEIAFSEIQNTAWRKDMV